MSVYSTISLKFSSTIRHTGFQFVYVWSPWPLSIFCPQVYYFLHLSFWFWCYWFMIWLVYPLVCCLSLTEALPFLTQHVSSPPPPLSSIFLLQRAFRKQQTRRSWSVRQQTWRSIRWLLEGNFNGLCYFSSSFFMRVPFRLLYFFHRSFFSVHAYIDIVFSGPLFLSQLYCVRSPPGI